MSLVSGAQSWGQALAESLMVDTVTIKRRGTEQVLQGDEYVWSYTTVYSGKCRLVLRAGAGVEIVDAQSQLLHVQEPRIDVPVSATTANIKPGDEFEITAGNAAGAKGVITGRLDQSLKTARRLPVQVAA